MKKLATALLSLALLLAVGCASKSDLKMNEGYNLIVKGDIAAAEQATNEALIEDPNNARAKINKGVILLSTGRVEEAKVLFQEVIDSGTTETAALSSVPELADATLVEIAQYNIAQADAQ